MTQCRIVNQDVHIIFIESDEVPIIKRLDNGTEIEFIDDNVSAIILPNFLNQLPPGLQFNELELETINEIDKDLIQIIFNIKGPKATNSIRATLDISSLHQKLYI